MPHVQVIGTLATIYVAPQGGGFVRLPLPRSSHRRVPRQAAPVVARVALHPGVRARTTPKSDIDTVWRSAELVHLVNASYRAGRTQLAHDRLGRRVTNCARADALLRCAYRAPYELGGAAATAPPVGARA